MKIGYCVPVTPQMASYRLRVAIPAPLLGREYEIGTIGNPSFFYKHFDGDLDLARSCGPFVYDVVNDHFTGKLAEHYQTMCGWASAVTCSSEAMRETIYKHTGMHAKVIDDPYENECQEPKVEDREVLWFGHQANIGSLFRVAAEVEDAKANLTICTNFRNEIVVDWSPDAERRCLDKCSVVLVTGNNPGASANRIVKALRAGRFVVTPGGVPAWDEWKDYIWIGSVKDGINWAFKHQEEACQKIEAGQVRSRDVNSPDRLAKMWTEVLDSISEPVISAKRDGLASIRRTTMP